MVPDYSDYFRRVQDCVSHETKRRAGFPLIQRDSYSHERLINLFTDCFDHHNEITDKAPISSFTLLKTRARRFVPRDEILVRFIDKHYKPPRILRSPYQSPPFADDHFMSMDDLCDDIQTNPITSDPATSLELGSNAYTYLLGDVGYGKTLFISALYRRLVFRGATEPYSIKDDDGYTVVPIYVNVDSRPQIGAGLPEIDSAWLEKHVVDHTISRLRAHQRLEAVSDIAHFNDPEGTGFANRMRKLTQFLAQRKVRLVLLLDNVDRYHFHYSKYRFSQHYKLRQREAVVKNLCKLISYVSDRGELGWCGLCVLFVCRDYVYDYLRNGCFDRSEFERDFGKPHKLVATEDGEVIESRRRLFVEALDSIPDDRLGYSREACLAAVDSLFDMTPDGLRMRPEINLVRRLGHHGNRSLVDFVGRLELNCVDNEVSDRLLRRQPKNIPTLYLLNLRRGFSQQTGHFPNLFLVDARVSIPDEFHLAHSAHRPTYWLKFLILKVISKFRSRHVSDLVRLFSVNGAYSEDLVRLSIGSLCSTNDSRCLDVDPASEITGSDPEVFVTERGKQLVAPSDAFGDVGLEFCFEFNYLQLVVDDPWLSIPLDYMSLIVSDLNYEYMTKRGSAYSQGSTEMVRHKAKAVMAFVAILKASLKHDLGRMPKLKQYLEREDLVPDLDAVQRGLLQTCKNLFARIGRESELPDLVSYWEGLRINEVQLDEFFATIDREDVLVS